MNIRQERSPLDTYAVSAEQMTEIESRIFAAGMPVEALMEKVAGKIVRRVRQVYSRRRFRRVGVLVGPGHNGGDALVVARELHHAGYAVITYQPFQKTKPLTAQHAQYAAHLGIESTGAIAPILECDLIIDGLFGFGLTRALEGEIAEAVEAVNTLDVPVVSIDIPSGLHTDTGEVLGTAVCATHTLCLGLWKLAFLQDNALDYGGQAELIDFDIPLSDIQAMLGDRPSRVRITPETAIAPLQTPLSPTTHKYKQGHGLLIAGSRPYRGAAVLAGLGARGSGVGMLSIAVPESLREQVSSQVPEALVIGCAETATGAIAQLPDTLNLQNYDAIACGPGLTLAAEPIVRQVLKTDRPLLLDADGLNALAQMGAIETLRDRPFPTVLTPHWGEFRRLFPEIATAGDRLMMVEQAAIASGATVILKGAKTAIAHQYLDGNSQVWINPDSTPALGRGGSGDVLTGLLGGLLAQLLRQGWTVEAIAQTAVWWHAQAGILAAGERTERGVDAWTLTQYLMPALAEAIS